MTLSVPTLIASREALAREAVLVEVTSNGYIVRVGYACTGTTDRRLCATLTNRVSRTTACGRLGDGPETALAALDSAVATGEIHSSRWGFSAQIEECPANILQTDADALDDAGSGCQRLTLRPPLTS